MQGLQSLPTNVVMAKTEIPDDVRRFILTSIPSVPHIEALILVHATAPRSWTVSELAQRLYVPAAVAESLLRDLCQSAMLQGDHATAAYFFDAQTNPLGQTIERLAQLYSTHLVEITLLIHSKLDRKAQQFADAFKLRKEA